MDKNVGLLLKVGLTKEDTDQWWLLNDIMNDPECLSDLGFDPEEDNDPGDVSDAWMEWAIDNSYSNITGQPVRDIISQVSACLDALQSDDPFDALTGLILSANLAHVNGFLLVDHFTGPLNELGFIIDSISQNGLEATFLDLDDFINNFQPYEPEYY